MRKSAFFAGVFLCAVVFIADTSTNKANALSPEQISFSESTGIVDDLVAMDTKIEQEPLESRKQDNKKPVVYTVKSGDTLIKIAKEHKTTWVRLFDKNSKLEHPDVILINQKITIPSGDEKLKSRELPAVLSAELNDTISETAPAASSPRPASPARARASASRGSSAGNGYVAGYCTWYVKNRRPDLPNNLGNANTWVARAAAQGLPTGSKPRVGAVGQQGMHVVYVEKVHNNGTVTISEMNFKGLFVKSTRTVSASNFRYIY